jgi:two-component system response regulator HydG
VRGVVKKTYILLVEDDPNVLKQLSGALEDKGYKTVRAGSAEEGIARFQKHDISLVITDLRLPGADGLELVEQVQGLNSNCPVLVITAHASVDSAVEAMRRGAFHYLEKPLSVKTLFAQVEKALEHAQVLKERDALRDRLSSDHGIGRILGRSKKIEALRKTIRQVAGTDSTVLVAGETGTGKELVVDALHYESGRAAAPLVKVNCAALTETLLESELFGHEKGAFTGADKRREGKFEQADGGTLLLDEITEMGAHVQAKLLRVLQGSEFERVGGNTPVTVNVRVVSATNRDPKQAVTDGKLREDLFYRLNVIRVDVPPLRERMEDISLFAENFIEGFAAKHRKKIHSISPEALAALSNYDWPGNVRELENCIERAVILASGKKTEKTDLPPPLSDASELPVHDNLHETLDLRELERQAVLRALEKSDWNKAEASRKLGIYVSSLYNKMKRFGIPQKR